MVVVKDSEQIRVEVVVLLQENKGKDKYEHTNNMEFALTILTIFIVLQAISFGNAIDEGNLIKIVGSGFTIIILLLIFELIKL